MAEDIGLIVPNDALTGLAFDLVRRFFVVEDLQRPVELRDSHGEDDGGTGEHVRDVFLRGSSSKGEDEAFVLTSSDWL